MEDGKSFEPGEIVYLAAEVSAGGFIFEVGTRAEVRGVSGSRLELELSAAEPVTGRCPTDHVVRAAERRPRTPVPWRGWRVRLRPGTV
jgi:hypothetical protein